jgi:hypothetical protein
MTSDLNHDDHAVDQAVRRIRDRFIERSDAAFDFEAGLADVRERAGLDPVLVRPPGRGPSLVPPAAVALAQPADELWLVLTALAGPGLGAPDDELDQPHVPTRDIRRAIEILAELRDGLESGRAARADAAASVRIIRDLLGRAAAGSWVSDAEARLAALDRAVASLPDGRDQQAGKRSGRDQTGLDRPGRALARRRGDQVRRNRRADGRW